MKSLVCLLTVIWLNHSLAKKILEQIFENSTLETFICSRCKVATDADFSSQMKLRLDSFDKYFKDLEDNREIFCSESQYTLVPMMKQVTLDMKRCFMQVNETFIPNFIFEGFEEFMDFLCWNRTIEIFYSQQGKDCVNALAEYQDGEDVRNCSCQLFKVFHNDILTEDDLCYELKSAEECFSEAITNACPHFFAFRMLNSQFFHAVGALCSTAAVIHLKAFMIMATVLLSLQNFVTVHS